MRYLLLGALTALLGLPLGAQAQDDPHDSMRRAITEFLTKPPELNQQIILPRDTPVMLDNLVLAELRFTFQKRMALTGHGQLFDIEGRPVEMDEKEMAAMVSEMLNVVRAEDPGKIELAVAAQEELKKIISEGEDIVRSKRFDGVEAVMAEAELVRAHAYRLPDSLRSQYLWRINFIQNAYVQRKLAKIDSFELIPIRGSLLDWINSWFSRTQYMRDCTAAGVPVPPDFSAAGGTPWRFQGQLSTKLIAAGDDANVWTWNQVGGRGACIALPRGTGGPGSLAGIICQSASTGNACFWDNIRRSNGTRIPWATETMVIDELQDGTNLAENCTNCHKGNNVFLVSPDDPTWCKLLRGGQAGSGCSAVNGPGSAGFTLSVEAPVRMVNVPNTSIQHSRYSPFSGTPARAGWVNNETVGCGGVCHLGSGGSFSLPPMPPSCGTDCY